MSAITMSPKREIIEDFAKEIRRRRTKTAKPSKAAINFRDDLSAGIERDVYKVPIDLLRYRKDNGRIASDVSDYERNYGSLDETDQNAQEEIRKFLELKDPEKTTTLKKAIEHVGQLEPAIVTADGFLINGNRRKMVMEGLHSEHPENDIYSFMKVVVLPDEGEPGGPPTLLEIEQIENRYQLQNDGKSEYYGFDRALSIKRKIQLGLSLEAQLRDDPRYARATKKELAKAVKDCKKEFLDPLDCVDRYLRQFNREGQYRTVSAGVSDRQGRWQAFKDYSNTYQNYLHNPKQREKLGIEDEDVGEIEVAAFDIIRLRNFPEPLPKVHSLMRNLHKYCQAKEGKEDGKNEIMKIADEVDPLLPTEKCMDKDGKPLSQTEIDAKWAAVYKQPITWHTKKAFDFYHEEKVKETPLQLLEAALKKLNHENMDLARIEVGDFDKARKLAADIKCRANELESQIFHQKKDFERLARKRHD